MIELFSQATGRWARISAEALARLDGHPEDPTTAPLRRRLEALGLRGSPDLTTWIPCRHRRVLLLPDLPALWVPVPSSPTSGGFPYRLLPLTPDDLRLWRAINESRPVAAVASVVGASAAQVLDRLSKWTARNVQALQLRPDPPRPKDPGLLQLLSPPRPPAERPAGQTLRNYHLKEIIDGHHHFDNRETTVAHALADPHPGLHGVAYGQRLRDRLRVRGWPVDGPVVEVGCGSGELAAAWGSSEPYLRIDLSPALLNVQQATAPATAGVLADAEHLPLREASVPLLLCNEVLADLPALPVPNGYANVGAWRFVAQVARVLAPGGQAILTEFGDPEAPPEAAVQLDHAEVSIHFGVLAALAGAIGLSAEIVRLDDLLGADLHAPQLSRHSWQALRARSHALGSTLKARAWTPKTLAATLPYAVEGLEWGTLAEDGPGPRITRFWALLLRRPTAAESGEQQQPDRS